MKMEVVAERVRNAALEAGQISQVGFGGFRIEPSDLSQRAALRQAIINGINLIDTCAIYADGKSEQCIGEVVSELIEEGVIVREDVCIVSKVGQIQGELYTKVCESDATPPAELLVIRDGMYAQCIHPDYIEQQITESLKRMNLSYVDTYLLHNPENYLLMSKFEGIEQEVAQAEFYRQIENALVQLEKEVQNGRIKNYGISSNTFHAPADSYEFTSLERVLEIAEGISPQHSFSMIQFPMNIIETGGMTEKNQSGGQNVVQFAKSKGVTVVVNRPFDAYYENLWIRLVETEEVAADHPAEIIRLLDELNDLEEELTEALPFSLAERKKLSLGIFLQQYWQDYSSYLHWDQMWSALYKEMVEEIVSSIDSQAVANAAESSLRYQQLVQSVRTAIERFYRALDHKRLTAVKRVVSQVNPDWADTSTITQSVIRALRSTEGIDCVLVGMRKESYVQDVLTELQQPIQAFATEVVWTQLQEEMKREVLFLFALLFPTGDDRFAVEQEHAGADDKQGEQDGDEQHPQVDPRVAQHADKEQLADGKSEDRQHDDNADLLSGGDAVHLGRDDDSKSDRDDTDTRNEQEHAQDPREREVLSIIGQSEHHDQQEEQLCDPCDNDRWDRIGEDLPEQQFKGGKRSDEHRFEAACHLFRDDARSGKCQRQDARNDQERHEVKACHQRLTAVICQEQERVDRL